MLTRGCSGSHTEPDKCGAHPPTSSSITYYIPHKNITNDKWQIVKYLERWGHGLLEPLCWHLPGLNAENNKIPQPGYLATPLRFQHSTSWTHVQCYINQPTSESSHPILIFFSNLWPTHLVTQTVCALLTFQEVNIFFLHLITVAVFWVKGKMIRLMIICNMRTILSLMVKVRQFSCVLCS